MEIKVCRLLKKGNCYEERIKNNHALCNDETYRNFSNRVTFKKRNFTQILAKKHILDTSAVIRITSRRVATPRITTFLQQCLVQNISNNYLFIYNFCLCKSWYCKKTDHVYLNGCAKKLFYFEGECKGTFSALPKPSENNNELSIINKVHLLIKDLIYY